MADAVIDPSLEIWDSIVQIWDDQAEDTPAFGVYLTMYMMIGVLVSFYTGFWIYLILDLAKVVTNPWKIEFT